MSQSSAVAVFLLSKEEQKQLSLVVEASGLEPRPIPPGALWRVADRLANATLYNSGKLVVQGKECRNWALTRLGWSDRSVSLVEQGEASTSRTDFVAHIGCDESGKGDFFGPLCVAAVFVSEQMAPRLLSLGIKDSKCLSDRKIALLYEQIRVLVAYEIKVLMPEEYNERYKEHGNLNTLLASLHADNIKRLGSQISCRLALVDQFASPNVLESFFASDDDRWQISQRVRAEDDIAVAAASVLARAAFLSSLEQMAQMWGAIPFPKGASSRVLDHARAFVQKHGAVQLSKVSKKHFVTAKQALIGLDQSL